MADARCTRDGGARARAFADGKRIDAMDGVASGAQAIWLNPRMPTQQIISRMKKRKGRPLADLV